MYSFLRFLPSVIRPRKPLHLVLFLTGRCNARCPFCFYAGGQGSSGLSELSGDEIAAISASLGELLWLAFSGGEIFLRDDLAEVAGLFYRNNRPSIILLPTNGLMPSRIRAATESILESCPKSVVVVKLSVDGMEGAHDGLRGVPGAFQKVMESYDSLADLLEKHRNFELGVNTVFCSDNQDQMDDIIDFVKELHHVRTHTISMVRGEIPDERYKDIDLGKYFSAIKRLEGGLADGSQSVYGFRGSRIKAAQDVIQRRLIHRTLSERRRMLPCRAGRLNVTVTETGNVYPCETFTEELWLGNVRKSGLHEILKNARAKEVFGFIDEGCFCTHECYMMTNVLFSPRMYPALLKETLRML